MKKLTVKKDIECMSCLSCVIACSEAFYKKFDQDLACIRIDEKNGTVKPFVCIQCGKCARACPQQAITQNPKGVYMINKKLCNGCGQCIEECPMKVMVKAETTSKCIACGICAKACPVEMLEISES